MGKLIQTKFNPETGKLERVDRGTEPIFNNKRKFIVEEVFDIITEDEGGGYSVPVEAYEVGFEGQGIYNLEVTLPTIQGITNIKKGSIIEL